MTNVIKYLALTLAIAGLFPDRAAGEEDAKAKARAHFESGSQAYREARYQDSIDAFVAAFQLDPDPALVFNTGQAWEKLGNVPNALRAYREYLRLAADAPDRAIVETIIRNLEARLREKGVQQVSVYTSPAGAELTIDGMPHGPTPWTGEIAAGRHQVVLRMAGHGETRKEFMLSPERAMDLDIDLSAVAATGGAATRTSAEVTPAVLVEAAPAPERPHPIHWWTYGALGAGAALVAGSGGFELARRSAESAAQNEPTQIQYKELYDQAQFHQFAARVLLGSSAVAAVVGGVLLFFDLSSSDETQKTAANEQS